MLRRHLLKWLPLAPLAPLLGKAAVGPSQPAPMPIRIVENTGWRSAVWISQQQIDALKWVKQPGETATLQSLGGQVYAKISGRGATLWYQWSTDATWLGERVGRWLWIPPPR